LMRPLHRVVRGAVRGTDAASAPAEDWVVFLHPARDEIVRASYRGPARVRGAAGTGKTVVALHRAAG